MQTFLPYSDFALSAEVLDYRRLGKQRVECKQLLNVILFPETAKGWKNHPAAKMWRGYSGALASYGLVVCEEWIKRGYKDTLRDFFLEFKLEYIAPYWLGDEDFHSSHRSNLLRKDPTFYEKFGWKEPDDLPYIWPEERNEEYQRS